MFKFKITTIFFFTFLSFSLYANNNNYNLKIQDSLFDLFSLIPVDKIKEEEKSLKSIFVSIESNDNLNEYQKYLQKRMTLIFSKSIYVYDDEKLLTLLAKESFPINVCFSYHFSSQSFDLMDKILQKVLYDNDNRVSAYNKSAKFLFSDDMNEKFKNFFPKNESEIIKNCT
jgi:hypothetical protein